MRVNQMDGGKKGAQERRGPCGVGNRRIPGIEQLSTGCAPRGKTSALAFDTPRGYGSPQQVQSSMKARLSTANTQGGYSYHNPLLEYTELKIAFSVLSQSVGENMPTPVMRLVPGWWRKACYIHGGVMRPANKVSARCKPVVMAGERGGSWSSA